MSNINEITLIYGGTIKTPGIDYFIIYYELLISLITSIIYLYTGINSNSKPWRVLYFSLFLFCFHEENNFEEISRRNSWSSGAMTVPKGTDTHLIHT